MSHAPIQLSIHELRGIAAALSTAQVTEFRRSADALDSGDYDRLRHSTKRREQYASLEQTMRDELSAREAKAS